MAACAACAHPVPSGARFCPSCGSPVARRRARRSRSGGSSRSCSPTSSATPSLAEHLDPEQRQAPDRVVLRAPGRRHRAVRRPRRQAARRRHRRPVRRAGRPRGRRRAGRAGRRCGCRRRWRRFVDGRPAPSPPIQMRVGINTGEVLVGTLAGSDYTAMGDVVNTASRLQALAPPGGVLVGSATAALCSPAIAREPFGVTRIRGREQVEQSWLVTGAAAGRHPARALRRAVRRAAPASGRCSTPPCSSCATATAASCRSSARPAPASPGSPTRSSTPLEGEAIVRAHGLRALRRVQRVGAGDHRAVDAVRPRSRRRRRRRRARSSTARADELWGLQPGDAELRPLPRRDRATCSATRRRSTGSTPPAPATPSPVTLTDMLRRHAQTRMTVLWVDNLQWADPIAARPARRRSCARSSDLPFLLVTGQRPDDDCVWPPPVERPLVLQVPLGPLGVDGRHGRSCAAILERGDGDEPSERDRRRARRPRRRQPAVPRRAGRAGRDVRRRCRSCPARCGP